MCKRHKLLLFALIGIWVFTSSVKAQSSVTQIRSAITSHFKAYQSPIDMKGLKVEKTEINHKKRSISVHLNQYFSYQLFTPELVGNIYDDLRNALPANERSYTLTVYTLEKKIEDLIPNHLRRETDPTLVFDTAYSGLPWVRNSSKPYTPSKGLENRHLFVSASHGYYWDWNDTIWEWQRPPLYGTREDILTQSIVYPYLIPMLENAGAVVYTPRERSWQTECEVVSTQSRRANFQQEDSRTVKWKRGYGAGYSPDSARIVGAEGEQAEFVMAESSLGKNSRGAACMFIPDIPSAGEYAVYVCYPALDNSVSDARFIIFHTGGATAFNVNQQMGGGTWVYLGTFHFQKGRNTNGMVALDNQSLQEGVVSVSAVRFGGGMGAETRLEAAVGKPRYMEGARYYARYTGAPDSVILKYDGKDEYKEDIWSRPLMANWLSGGSITNPSARGENVPLELSLSLHTDAGWTYSDSIVGTLGIHTTNFNNGVLATGLSRSVSRTLAHTVVENLKADIENTINREWVTRGLWDKSYCESREAVIPSLLVELLSHQNFYDMRLAHDPHFRFLVSRSIYKSVARYTNFMHAATTVIQPLPVTHFAIEREGLDLKLTWRPQSDPLEPLATAASYILYTAMDQNGYDNGTPVAESSIRFSPSPGHIYRFKVTALNEGGESFPSEELSAYISDESSARTLLVVNGFQRLSPPASVDTPEERGFLLDEDPGVGYMSSPILAGYQQIFSTDHISETEDTLLLGWGGDEFDGRILAGNTFNYPTIHGRAIVEAEKGNLSYISCSREAVEDGMVRFSDYKIVDLILGLQKRSSSDTVFHHDYTTFTPALQEEISNYLEGGGRLLISGSYVGADMNHNSQEREFTNTILKFSWNGSVPQNQDNTIKGSGLSFQIAREPDKEFYALPRPDELLPLQGARTLFSFKESGRSAAVIYSGRDYRVVTLGFPFESINDEKSRKSVMQTIMDELK